MYLLAVALILHVLPNYAIQYVKRSYFDVRLVDGANPSEGRLEVNYLGEWGTVCDDLFDDDAARVVCKQLGYGDGQFHGNAHYGMGTGPIILDNVICASYEENLDECWHSVPYQHDCTHEEDVGISCAGISESNVHDDGSVRLVGGQGSCEGRLEIFHDGEWGTVCDDFFDDLAAGLVCSQLGFTGGQAFGESYFGQGEGSIHLDNVNCFFWDDSIVSCEHNYWGMNDCTHSEDVGVICEPSYPTTSTTASVSGSNVRLVDGIDAGRGRVEIFHDGEWGTVCDDKWDDVDATVICKSLGYIMGIARDSTWYGPGTGIIWLDELECTGEEDDISQCGHNGWAHSDCLHGEDAGASCWGHADQEV